jgi:hypothetical protein
MLGLSKPRRLDEPNAASLETLVPADHFYRHLEPVSTSTFCSLPSSEPAHAPLPTRVMSGLQSRRPPPELWRGAVRLPSGR